jgi:hypothetical protein
MDVSFGRFASPLLALTAISGPHIYNEAITHSHF